MPISRTRLAAVALRGASLDYPRGIAADNGSIDVSNTADHIVASIVGAAKTTIAGL